MKKFFIRAIFLGLLISAGTAMGQSRGNQEQDPLPATGNKRTVIISANTEYDKAGKLKRFYFGDHYRKEWATPVEIEILDLDSIGGGLKPVRIGGGQQTKSLRLQGNDGKEYVLRSVNKDPSKAIPRELVGTFADDIVQDQISSSNPYAPLAVAELAEAAGIFHTQPRLVYVPSSLLSQEFSKDFANTVCLLEERPVSSQQGNPAFGNSTKIINSEKLFQKLSETSDHRMDQRAFLRARLFDMWIGDWDRHEDQWLWAAFDQDNKTIYKPIPRDRDQAFSKLDGLIPKMAARPWSLRKIKNFDYVIHDVNGLNMNGVFLDKNFTTELSLQDWMEIAGELQHDLTDEKISKALRMMPENIFDISGSQVIAKLKSRRDALKKYASTYYHFLSREVNIAGTGQKEFFEVKRINADSTKLTVYKLNRSGQPSGIIFQRIFLRRETKEIRIYGLGGDDQFDISGAARKGILLRIIGGEGKDSINDRSAVSGWQYKTRAYDNAGNVFNLGAEGRAFISSDSLKNNYRRRSFRYDWFAPQFAPGYNPDDGFYTGGGIVFKKQKFGKAPYGYMQSVKANYAFETGAYNFWYEGIFKEAIGKWDLHLEAQVNAPNYVFNYFGLGNETGLTEKDKNYNRIRSDQLIISAAVDRQFGKHISVQSGISYQSIKVEESSDRFVTSTDSKLDSNSFDRKYFATAMLGYQFNSTDNALYPRRGIKVRSVFEFTQNIQEKEKNFGRLSSDASFYVSVSSLTAAFRIGGSTIMGNDYEFFQANTLGGSTNLRGFRKSRFAGERSLYQDTELRLKFKSMNGYFLRGNWGLLGFFDNGRVWVSNETSNQWHYGYGGGFWFMPYDKMALTATYGISKESKIISVKAGFLF